jgi:type I restriction enzyme S subunit
VAVKRGYKQTEAGMIPEDWEVKLIHELASIKTGPFGTLLKASEYSDGEGVPLISVGEIREGFLRTTEHTPCVSKAVTLRLSQYVLRSGDIVFGRKGGVERSALIRRQQEGWFLGSDGIRIRPLQACDYEYLAFQFQSARIRGWLLQNAIGTTMPSLNQDIIRKVAIPLPPTKAEQEAIAEALSDADALIASLEQLVAKKRQVKQGAMQELLTGKKRLPGFEVKRGYKQTETGEIPEDWDVVQLARLLEFRNGVNSDKKDYGAGTSFINVLEVITKSHLRMSDIPGRVSLSKSSRDAYSVRRGDLVFNRTSETQDEIGLASVFLDDGPVVFGGFVIRGRPIPGAALHAEYAGYAFRAPAIRWQIVARGQGAIRANIGQADLRAIFVPLPDPREQAAIATILSDMDAEIAALEAKLAKARQIKQGMMQELLTGRIRLV